MISVRLPMRPQVILVSILLRMSEKEIMSRSSQISLVLFEEYSDNSQENLICSFVHD